MSGTGPSQHSLPHRTCNRETTLLTSSSMIASQPDLPSRLGSSTTCKQATKTNNMQHSVGSSTTCKQVTKTNNMQHGRLLPSLKGLIKPQTLHLHGLASKVGDFPEVVEPLSVLLRQASSPQLPQWNRGPRGMLGVIAPLGWHLLETSGCVDCSPFLVGC